jgi:hypothetical protein
MIQQKLESGIPEEFGGKARGSADLGRDLRSFKR